MVLKAKEQAAKKLRVPGKIFIPVDNIIRVVDKERELAELKVQKDKEIARKDKELAELKAQHDKEIARKDKELAELKAQHDKEIAELQKRFGT
jgi:hypothetical protein